MHVFIQSVLSFYSIFEVSLQVKIHFRVLWIQAPCSLVAPTQQIMTYCYKKRTSQYEIIYCVHIKYKLKYDYKFQQNFPIHSKIRNVFSCFQVLLCGQMERQIEKQVQKQSITNMHFTANTHTTVHNVKLTVTQHTPQNIIQ